MWWVKTAFMMLFHPLEMVTLIKRKRESIPIGAIFFPFFISAMFRIASVYLVNYTVSTIQPKNANLFFEIGIDTIPVILWAIACYAFMTINGGEATFKETIVLSAYSMMPIIVIRPILLLLSQALSFSERGLYQSINTLMIIWFIILLFITFKESNNISFGRALAYSLIIIIAMFLIVAVVLLAFALDSQIVTFIQEIISETNFFLR